MPIDPCFAALVAEPRNVLRALRSEDALPAFRAAAEAPLRAITGPAVDSVETHHAAADDRSVAIRLYRPTAETRLPVITFIHGGGFVFCSLDSHDALCRELAVRTGAAVAAVEYRLAPEARFPGAIEDCHAALAWVAAHAASLGLDGDRLALCGDSAGGNIAIATAMLARGQGPALRHLGLVYPVIDPACDSASMAAFADGPVISQAFLQWGWRCYLGSADPHNPLADVGRADLAELPPTTVLTAEFDPLRDEGESFAAALRAVRVPVMARRYSGMIHGFASMSDLTPVAGAALADLAKDLRESLAR